MGRISDETLEKIENLKETQSQEGKKKKIPSIQTWNQRELKKINLSKNDQVLLVFVQ